MKKTTTERVGAELLASMISGALLAGVLLFLFSTSIIVAILFGPILISFNYPYDANQPISYARIWLVGLWVVWPFAWIGTRLGQRVARQTDASWAWLWRRRLALARSLALAFSVWVALFFVNLYLPWEY